MAGELERRNRLGSAATEILFEKDIQIQEEQQAGVQPAGTESLPRPARRWLAIEPRVRNRKQLRPGRGTTILNKPLTGIALPGRRTSRELLEPPCADRSPNESADTGK